MFFVKKAAPAVEQAPAPPPKQIDDLYDHEQLVIDLATLSDYNKLIDEQKAELKKIAEKLKAHSDATAPIELRVGRYLAKVNELGHEDKLDKTIAGYRVVVSAGPLKREADAKKVYDLLPDKEVFWQGVSVTMSFVDNYLTLPQRKIAVTEDRTGDRKVSVKKIEA